MALSICRKSVLICFCCQAITLGVFGQWTSASLSSQRITLGTSVGTKVIFGGGTGADSHPTDIVDIYDDATGIWSTHQLVAPRSSLAVTTVQTKAIFAGGLFDAGILSDDVDFYSNGVWTSASLSYARFGLAAASAGTKALFAGGYDFNTELDVVDIYNNTGSTWTTATLSAPRNALAGAGAGSKVLFAGGYYFNASFEQVYSNVVDIYDVGTGAWTTAALSQPRAYLVGASVGTKIFFAGGYTDGYVISDVVDIYNTSTGTWTTATLSHPRSGLAATTVGSKVFFAGGADDTDVSNVVDIYDNATGLWTTATLPVPRNVMAAASVGSKAFFAGGYTSGYSNAIDIYDASCNSGIISINPSSASICEGESVVLTASGGSNYQWSPATGLTGIGGTTVTASPTTTTTYQVYDPGLNACTSVTVNVGHPVTLTTSSSKGICSGNSVTLYATSTGSITWSPAAGLSGTTGPSVIASPTGTTTYTVTASDGGCHVSSNITVTVYTCTGWSSGQIPPGRWSQAATSVGNKALFAGGTVFGSSMDTDPTNYSDFVDIYDKTNDTWNTEFLSRARTELAATTVGTKALFGGGRHEGGTFLITSSSIVDIFDEPTGNWSTAALSEARHELAAASAGGKALFAGGFSYENGFTNAVDIYDVGTGNWTTSTLSVARGRFAAASVGTKIFFAGGMTDSGPTTVVDIYDASNGNWSTANLSEARQYLAGASLGTKVFFAGGRRANDTQSAVVDIYDNSTGQWTTATLLEARDLLAGTAVGTQVIFAGGYHDGEFTNTVDMYDNSTGTWSNTALSIARSAVAGTALSNKALFKGGQGAQAADSKTLDVYDFPCGSGITISPNVTICQGASTILTATGAVSYTWSPGTGLSGTTGSSVTATPSATIIYSVTGDHGNGCESIGQVTVTVTPQPNVNVSGTTTICNGSSTTLTASGADTYTWSPATGLSATTGSSVSANPTTTITYTAQGTQAGCNGTKNVTVTVNPKPTVTVTPSTSICGGSSTGLTASGALSYAWSPSGGLSGTTGASVTASPLITTTYVVVGTAANSCTNFASTTVTVNDPPKPVITVTFVNSFRVNLESSALSGNQWFRNGVPIAGANGSALQTSGDGVYTVQATISGCVSPLSDGASVVVTAIEGALSTRMRVYPNPADETLQVVGPDFDPSNVIEISVLDLTGRQVMSQLLPGTGGALNVGSLAPGFYIVQAAQGTRVRTQRFIKR